MKHTTVITALLGLLLAPLLMAQSAVPTRTEQGSLIFDGIPPRDPALSAQLARWLDPPSTEFVDWLADGSLLVSTRAGDTTQVHRVRAPLAAREQLIVGTGTVSTAVAHPYDANVLVFLKDRGDAGTQLWLHNLASGSDQLLTDGKSLTGPPVFAHDGKRLAFYSTARDGVSFDVYLRDTTSDALPQLLMAGGRDALYVQDWSLDDRRLAVIRRTSTTDSQLLLVDTATGALSRIEPGAGYPGGPLSITQARFSRDGRGLYFLSDRGGEFIALHYLDLYTNELRTLTPDSGRDVERFALSQDGRFVAYTRNEASVDRLVLYDVLRKVDLLLPPLPAGALISAIGFDRSSRRLAVAVQNAQTPQDVYVYGIEPAAGDAAALPAIALVRWTQSELGAIAASPVPVQLSEFPTWDRVGNRQRMLPAFLFKPRTPGPHPVIIDMHGGPGSQFRPQWNPFTQYLVNEGYAVVAPNVRGSEGYGRSFLQLDDGALREDPVRDIGALLVWIGLQPDFNRKRVAIMDDSSGGYLALASLANYGDRLAGGIVRNILPLNNAASIRRPLLIAQGLGDPRVPSSESQLMTARLRANGGEVWYLAVKDEGRDFSRKANRDEYLATVAAFLKHISP